MKNLEGKTFKLGLYKQCDLFDPEETERYGLAVLAEEDGEPYACLTVNLPSYVNPDVCEVICIPNAAYIDNNNCPWAVSELIEMGIAKDTGYTKGSGWCEYPLLQFDEEWLKSVDAKTYAIYKESWDAVFGEPDNECD